MFQDTQRTDRHKRRRKPSAAERGGIGENRRQAQEQLIAMTTGSLDRIRV